MSRYLVAGGAGFLGANMVRELLARGHEVVVLDNLCTGSMDNLRDLSSRRFSFLFGDVCDMDVLTKRLNGRFDYIVHLASPASPPVYQRLPFETMWANTIGTRNLLQVTAWSQATFLFASTSEIYGDPEISPQPETYRGNVSTIGPRACYDEAKRLGETITEEFRRQYNARVRISRTFNTFGPFMSPEDGRVVSNLICQALRGDPLTIYGDGSQTRSFCYVDDQIEGLLALLHCEDDTIDPVNVGNPVEMTMIELAEAIIEGVESTSEIVFKPLPTDDPRQRRPDISRAKRLLGWEPKVRFEDGLAQTIQWFRQCLDQKVKPSTTVIEMNSPAFSTP